jgi:hypothetical protein
LHIEHRQKAKGQSREKAKPKGQTTLTDDTGMPTSHFVSTSKTAQHLQRPSILNQLQATLAHSSCHGSASGVGSPVVILPSVYSLPPSPAQQQQDSRLSSQQAQMQQKLWLQQLQREREVSRQRNEEIRRQVCGFLKKGNIYVFFGNVNGLFPFKVMLK